MLGLQRDPNRSGGFGFIGVTLVGGGPGDPELITVAGLKALMAADVVVVDHLAPGALIDELEPHVEVVDVAKHPRGRSTPQEAINALLVDRARAGKHVVRLKGGDVYVFGRGFEELTACQEAGIPVRVVPGLSSSIAVPALAGIPLTHRGLVQGFTVVSGHLPPDHRDSLTDWTALAALPDTLVLLMAVANGGAIAAELMAGGRAAATPVAIVCNGTLPTQRSITSTLGALGSALTTHDVHPPAVIVIGEVVGLRLAPNASGLPSVRPPIAPPEPSR